MTETATKYEGLWRQERTGWYKSRVFTVDSLIDLFSPKDRFQIILKQNKYWKTNESNIPRFIFSIVDRSVGTLKTSELESDNGAMFDSLCNALEENDEYYKQKIIDSFDEDEIEKIADWFGLYTESQVQYCIDKASADGARGYTDNIIEDYL